MKTARFMHSEEPPHPEPSARSDPSPSPSKFPSTRWTLVRRIAEGAAPDREVALDEVCRLYWPPVYAYLRAQGKHSHDAEDLTQGFFEQLLRGDAFSRLRAEQGRLRSYLLRALRNFLASEHVRERCLKRGGGTPAVIVDPAALEALAPWIEGVYEVPPDRAFDRLWAATVLENGFQRVARRYRERGQPTLFEALSSAIRAEGGNIDYAAASERLGIAEPTLRVAVHRLRKRYGEALREIVSATLDPGEDPEEELRQLRAVFE